MDTSINGVPWLLPGRRQRWIPTSSIPTIGDAIILIAFIANPPGPVCNKVNVNVHAHAYTGGVQGNRNKYNQRRQRRILLLLRRTW